MRDFDFHPDEDSVRCFGVPVDGVLVDDADAVIYQTLADDVVLQHHAFANEWFKLNVTLDLGGDLVETGPGPTQYAVNCDIATPMRRHDGDIAAVDLFLDVLIGSDCRTYSIVDRDEFDAASTSGLISADEARAAESGLGQLIGWIESGRLEERVRSWRHKVRAAPAPLPFSRAPIDASPFAGREFGNL